MALALLDARHKYMAKVIATSFGMAAPSVEEVLASEENLQAAEDFFRADGAPKLLFYRQARDVYTEDDDAAEPDGPADQAARDSWRARLWTFLVRPYLETLWQFREVVRLFRHLEAGGAPADGAPSFKSVRSGETVNDDDEAAEWQLTFE